MAARPEPVSFLERIVRFIEIGTTTSPYKLLLLMSILDAVPTLDIAAATPTPLPLRVVAERAIELVWPQVAPYRGVELGRATVSGGLETQRIVLRARSTGASLGAFMTDSALTAARGEVTSRMAWVLAQWPVPRLQTVRGEVDEILWEVPQHWREHTLSSDRSRRPVPRRMFELESGTELPLVYLRCGVAELLFRVGPLLRSSIQLRWAQVVAAADGLVGAEPVDLVDHLFPLPDRQWTARCANALAELQSGRCFWCTRSLQGAIHVDHVTPWSLWRNDAIENLVATDEHCNRIKSDRLLAPALIHQHVAHIRTRALELAAIARRASLRSNPALTLACLRSSFAFGSPTARCFDIVDARPVTMEQDRRRLLDALALSLA